MPSQSALRRPFRFGEFELDPDAGELRKNGRRIKVQPQPFKLLMLLAGRAGRLVTRDEIRRELWAEGTFVDFDQAVNFSIKQVRDVLRDDADRPLYIETVPKRGYRFIAPLDTGEPQSRKAISNADGTTVRLQKALWTNIAELRLAEARRRRNAWVAAVIVLVLVAALALFLLLR